MVADAAPGAGTRPPGPAGAASPGLGTMLSSVGAGRAVGALALVALTALLLAWGPDARLRGLWFDFCQRLAPRVRLSGPAVIVAVDEPPRPLRPVALAPSAAGRAGRPPPAGEARRGRAQPPVPVPGEGRFRIAAVMEPARVVGGDLFDFFLLDGDRLLFLVGDVSGKGLPASLFMAATKAPYRSISSRHPADLARIMREANAEIGRDKRRSS